MKTSVFLAVGIVFVNQTTSFAVFMPMHNPDAERDAWAALVIILFVASVIAGIRDAFNER